MFSLRHHYKHLDHKAADCWEKTHDRMCYARDSIAPQPDHAIMTIPHVAVLEELRGCHARSASDIRCQWGTMDRPTCPKPGKNVAMPAHCRHRLLVVL